MQRASNWTPQLGLTPLPRGAWLVALPNALLRSEGIRILRLTMGGRLVLPALHDTSRAGTTQRLFRTPALSRDLAEHTPEAVEAEAVARARTPSTGSWPALSPEQRAEIRALVQSADRASAPTSMWQMLRSDLPLGNVVEVQCTTSLGQVGGRTIAVGGGGATALALPYVARKPECATAASAVHWQLHSADEIRAIIQVSPSVLHGEAEEVVAKLHSTLMHEYRHAEQARARGLFAGLAFVVVDQREFLSEQGVPQPQRGRIEALDEIDATCAEIENAERTGLASSYEMRATVCYLWDKYLDYFRSIGGQPNSAVASRVYSAIQCGRRWFRQYLESPKGAWVPAQARPTLLAACPLGYNPAQIEPFIGP
ncbi:MAG: hypothetical protein ACP5SI_06965 [Chloroflexia bacterium]